MCVGKLHSFEISIVRVDVNKILHNSVAEVILFLKRQMEIHYIIIHTVKSQNIYSFSIILLLVQFFSYCKITVKPSDLCELCTVFCILTTVWTICGLWVRELFTVWNTSSNPSALTRSKMLLRAMKVPVRPAPALMSPKKKNIQNILFW